jgi:3-deoxy-manno-octulosonate cytidylyltransferase (CMP-KDO synthetase)
LIKKEQIEELLSCFEDDRAQIATLVKKFDIEEDVRDHHKVKVVINKEHNALYFSRLPVPYQINNDEKNHNIYLKHIGIYGYRAPVLHSICELSPSMTELAESLEQLRWLENAYSIKTKLTEYLNIGIDTPEDLSKLSALLDRKLG